MYLIARKVVKISPGLRLKSVYSIENLLNEDNISKTIARLKGMRPMRLQTHEPVKKSAVIIPVCTLNKNISLMYTLRNSCKISARDEIHFPGGIQDASDKDIIETALKKLKVDLGISSDDVKIWGMGNLIVARSDVSLMPIVVQIKGEFDIESFKISNEIREVFTVNLQDLCNSKTNTYTQFKDSYSAPVFMGGKRRIWGLTAMITNIFLKALFPDLGYSHRIRYIPSVKRSSVRN